VTTRWRHRSGWPTDPAVQPVAWPVKNMPRWVELGWFFFTSAQAVARVFMARVTALIAIRTHIGLLPGRFLAVFFNGFFRWVFLLPRVGAGWANRANGFGPGRPMGQKNFTGRVTARVKNRVKHTFFYKL
jgi:hypothetical protein